jgi:glucokinase
LEDSVSARALETGYLRHSGRRISGAEIAARADAGDAAARDTFERFGAALGDGLAWIAAVLDPEVIVLGGSIAASWEFFQAAMWRSLETHSVAGRRLKVLPTQLGEKAALLGAAWCFRHAGERPFQE